MRALRIKIIGTDAAQLFQTRLPVIILYCMYVFAILLACFIS